jgi:hypothetical protein
LLNGLLQKAQSADELAGVVAHEMGHISHRDHTRMMVQRGGASFLVGLLWGDITGSAAVIFVTRTLFEVSYSQSKTQMTLRSEPCTRSAARLRPWESCCFVSPARREAARSASWRVIL